jgi:hypothetical protein
MSAHETQALMQEIARKERELSRRTEIPSSCTPDDRLATALIVSVALAVLALIGGVVCGAVGGFIEQPASPTALRSVLSNAPSIPWRHFRNARCHVWVSELGAAEIFCDGHVIYRAFGSLSPDGRFSTLPLYQSYAHEIDRGVEIDLGAGRAELESLWYCSGSCGARTLQDLVEVHP